MGAIIRHAKNAQHPFFKGGEIYSPMFVVIKGSPESLYYLIRVFGVRLMSEYNNC
jgi:hypothetical protein